MKLGIIGLPLSGKTTLFEALTRTPRDPHLKGEGRLGTVEVPDDRVDILSRIVQPKKSTYVHVTCFLPGMITHGEQKEQSAWNQVRDCDALIHVIRNFSGPGFGAPAPVLDYQKTSDELLFADLLTAEKRLKHLESDKQRSKPVDEKELSLIRSCYELLEQNIPLRRKPELASDPLLKGYAFLTAKPQLILFNNDDEDESFPEAGDILSAETCMVVRAKLEEEISEMSQEEAEAFLKEFHLEGSTRDRVVRKSCEVLNYITFLTANENEVRAWNVIRGTPAVEAAGVVHTDMEKGFIRAEVIHIEDLKEAGTFAEARKKGTFRLEGREYAVKDGDVLLIRFNV